LRGDFSPHFEKNLAGDRFFMPDSPALPSWLIDNNLSGYLCEKKADIVFPVSIIENIDVTSISLK